MSDKEWLQKMGVDLNNLSDEKTAHDTYWQSFMSSSNTSHQSETLTGSYLYKTFTSSPIIIITIKNN